MRASSPSHFTRGSNRSWGEEEEKEDEKRRGEEEKKRGE